MPVNTEREPPYLDYEHYLSLYGKPSEVSEGTAAQPMSEGQWNSMGVKERYSELVQFGQFDANPDQVAKFRAQFGEPPTDWFGKAEGQWTPGDAKGLGYVLSLEPPQFAPGSVFDQSRTVQDPDTGYWITEVANTRPDWIAQQQAADDETGTFHGDWRDIVTIAAVFAAGYGGAMLLGEGAAGAVVGEGVAEGAAATGAFDAGVAGGIEGGVTPSLYGGAAGAVEPYAGSALAATEAGAGTTAGLPSGTQAPAPVTEAPLPAGTQAPAPVVEAGTPAPGTSPGGGILDGARNAANGASQWYSRLSPASRMILNAGVSQGLQGLNSANAQREASQAAEERDSQLREDRIRRTGVPVFGGAFTPRTPGIIDSRRNGG